MENSSSKNSPLSLKDLSILMEAYKNNIELSTTLLEQEKQVLLQQDEIIEKQNKLLDNLEQSQRSCDDKVKTVTNVEYEILDLIKTFRTDLALNLEKKSSSVKALIYGSYVGMLTIIISLIGLIYLLTDKIK